MESKLVLITGASRGLGRAMTEKFIALGHTVIGCARSQKEIGLLQKKFPLPHDFSVVDVTSEDQVRKWAERVLPAHGVPRLVINNAAIINRNASLWQVTGKEMSEVFAVNVLGTANVLRYFLPPMIQRKSGTLVNFSSGWGRSVDAQVAPYCASKWAIEGLTQALALELPAGMVAVPLNPGMINTEMLQSCFGSSAGAYPNPQEWAERAVPFILGLKSGDNGRPLTVPGS